MQNCPTDKRDEMDLAILVYRDQSDAIRRESKGGVVVAGLDGESLRVVLLQVEHGDFVTDRAEESRSIRCEDNVAFPVNRSKQVGEFEGEFHVSKNFKGLTECPLAPSENKIRILPLTF